MHHAAGAHQCQHDQLQLSMTKMPTSTFAQKTYQRGFTLLEVLIALLVLSIGLLGLASLQTVGLRSNTMATTRTHATQLAYDISDRMRANLAATYTANANNVVTAILTDYALASCAPPLPDPTVNQANDDLNTWCNTISTMLPAGDAQIVPVRQAGIDGVVNTIDDVVTYDVTVYWDEARTGATTKGCDPLNKNDLRCIQLNVTIPRPLPNA
jgi:type IV pilus assembly protein PilV